MSTKIYNAYKLYTTSILEIRNMIHELKKDVYSKAKEIIEPLIAKQVTYFLDYRTIHGTKKCAEMAENTSKDKADTYLHKIWSELAKEENFDETTLKMLVSLDIRHKIEDFEKYPNRGPDRYDFRCQMIFFPLVDKTLCMYFGREEFLDVILNMRYHNDAVYSPFEDYHYQNSTDRPADISKKEWAQRADDWEKALGYDAPINRGFSVNMLDTNRLYADMLNMLQNLPEVDLETRANMITCTFDDYPDPPEGENVPVSEWMTYIHTQAYCDWHKAKKQLVINMLTDITKPDANSEPEYTAAIFKAGTQVSKDETPETDTPVPDDSLADSVVIVQERDCNEYSAYICKDQKDAETQLLRIFLFDMAREEVQGITPIDTTRTHAEMTENGASYAELYRSDSEHPIVYAIASGTHNPEEVTREESVDRMACKSLKSVKTGQIFHIGDKISPKKYFAVYPCRNTEDRLLVIDENGDCYCQTLGYCHLEKTECKGEP